VPPNVGSSSASRNRALRGEEGRAKSMLFLAVTAIALAERAIGPLMPFIRRSIDLSDMQVAYAGGAVVLGSLLGVIPLSHLLHRVRAELAIAVNLLAVGVACAIIALQTTLLGLAVGLLALGVIRSGVVPTVNKAVAAWFPRSRRGGAMGFVHMGAPVGGVIAGLCLPLVARSVGWGSSFYVLATVAILCAMVPTLAGWSSLRSGSAERALIIQRDGGSWRRVMTIGLIYGLVCLGDFGGSLYLALYLVDRLRVDPVAAGVFFGIALAGSAGGRALWGKLLDGAFRQARHMVLSLIAFASGVSFILLILLSPESPQPWVVLVVFLFGASTLSSWGVLSTILSDVVGEAATATATASILCIAWGSGVIGQILFGFILDRFRSYALGFGLFAAFALVAALMFSMYAGVRDNGHWGEP